MRAARMHGYNQPLRIDEVPVPDPGPTELSLKVAATGMCRNDSQLLDGYFRQGLPMTFPFTPGREVAGTIAALGAEVPTAAYFASCWGNDNDLTEVLTLASEGLIKHHVVPVKLDDVNDTLDALGRGDIVWRAVIVFDRAEDVK